MDLRVYYQKIRKIEAELGEPFVVVVSRDTPEGGKHGNKTEVPRALAAKLIAEEKADLAAAEDAAQYRREQEERWKIAQESAGFSEADVKLLRNALRPARK